MRKKSPPTSKYTKGIASLATPKDEEFKEISTLLQQGLSSHRSGLLLEAKSLYQQILKLNPNHFDALQLCAAVDTQTQNWTSALKLFEQALHINPKNAAVYFNQGIVLQELKRFDEALDSYINATELKNDYAQAYANMGIVHIQLNQLPDAVQCFDKAIEFQNDDANSYFNRGVALKELGRMNDAILSYDRAIELERNYPEAFSNKGIAQQSLGRLDEALQNFNKAISLKSDFAEAYSNRSIVLQKQGRLDEALRSCDQAIEIKADYAQAYSNRGSILSELERLDEAKIALIYALELNPNYPEAYYNLGVVFKKLTLLNEALINFDCAIKYKHDYAEAHYNKGVVLSEMLRLDEGLISYDEAIKLDPEYTAAHWNKSLTLLLKGDFYNGFRGYEWRWKNEKDSDLIHNASFHSKLWLGAESLEGKKLFIRCEQGLGDTLQFCRYTKMATEHGASVTLEVQRPLLKLLNTLEGVRELHPLGSPLPDFDFQCPTLSLPLAFKTNLEDIPNKTPYIKSNRVKREEWAQRLGLKSKPRVGLVWSGSTAHKNDQNRSIPLADLNPFLPDLFEYICLQNEIRDIDSGTLRVSNIKNYSDLLIDFEDTAALCDLMDLVICVDTSVAHLAGALGKKTWILLPYAPDWRWMLGRTDSPWYSSVRLYRQQSAGDWRGLFKTIEHDISKNLL